MKFIVYFDAYQINVNIDISQEKNNKVGDVYLTILELLNLNSSSVIYMLHDRGILGKDILFTEKAYKLAYKPAIHVLIDHHPEAQHKIEGTYELFARWLNNQYSMCENCNIEQHDYDYICGDVNNNNNITNTEVDDHFKEMNSSRRDDDDSMVEEDLDPSPVPNRRDNTVSTTNIFQDMSPLLAQFLNSASTRVPVNRISTTTTGTTGTTGITRPNNTSSSTSTLANTICNIISGARSAPYTSSTSANRASNTTPITNNTSTTSGFRGVGTMNVSSSSPSSSTTSTASTASTASTTGPSMASTSGTANRASTTSTSNAVANIQRSTNALMQLLNMLPGSTEIQYGIYPASSSTFAMPLYTSIIGPNSSMLNDINEFIYLLENLEDVPITIDKETVSKLPVFKWNDLRHRNLLEPQDKCSICMESFIDSDDVRVLLCKHCFHPKCVDIWLTEHNTTCPLCRTDAREGMN